VWSLAVQGIPAALVREKIGGEDGIAWHRGHARQEARDAGTSNSVALLIGSMRRFEGGVLRRS
jgi:hypothetical protein